MCFAKSYKPKKPQIAMIDNDEATAQATLEARLRRRRAGAAADILTSPVGIPSTPVMGATA